MSIHLAILVVQLAGCLAGCLAGHVVDARLLFAGDPRRGERLGGYRTNAVRSSGQLIPHQGEGGRRSECIRPKPDVPIEDCVPLSVIRVDAGIDLRPSCVAEFHRRELLAAIPRLPRAARHIPSAAEGEGLVQSHIAQHGSSSREAAHRRWHAETRPKLESECPPGHP